MKKAVVGVTLALVSTAAFAVNVSADGFWGRLLSFFGG